MLVAIAIPVFTTQLEKSRETTDMANVRSAYAAGVTKYLDDCKEDPAMVRASQKVSGWMNGNGSLQEMVNGSLSNIQIPESGAKDNGSWVISISTDGTISIS